MHEAFKQEFCSVLNYKLVFLPDNITSEHVTERNRQELEGEKKGSVYQLVVAYQSVLQIEKVKKEERTSTTLLSHE